MHAQACAGGPTAAVRRLTTNSLHVTLNVKMDVTRKRVSFNPEPAKVYIMHVWDFASRSARRSEWEQVARDRMRFKARIEKLSSIIDIVLVKKHIKYLNDNKQ